MKMWFYQLYDFVRMGIMNIKEKLAKLPEKSTCVIEVKTIAGLKKSVEYMKNNKIK